MRRVVESAIMQGFVIKEDFRIAFLLVLRGWVHVSASRDSREEGVIERTATSKGI